MLSEPIKIRINFSKTGRLKFISHLDLQRFAAMMMQRAALPLWFTEGFNPHPKMVFSPPLSLGVESECEYLDTKIIEEIDFEKAIDQLNRASVPEIEIKKIYIPEGKLSDICYASYRIEFENTPDVCVLEKDSLIVEKKSKSKNASVDILPMIKEFSATENTLCCTLDCSGSSYLNPEYVCGAVNRGGEYSITRTGFFKKDGFPFS